MPVSASLKEDTFRVRENCSVEVIITSSEPLAVGDTVEVQFPNTWTILTGPSFTRELQTTDPEAPHYVCARAEGATFDVEVKSNHLYTGRPGRHGRNSHGRKRTHCRRNAQANHISCGQARQRKRSFVQPR